jgi:vancomycin permeability regulator SanA
LSVADDGDGDIGAMRSWDSGRRLVRAADLEREARIEALMDRLRAARPAVMSLAALLFAACVAVTVAGQFDHVGKSDLGVVLGNKVERNGQPSLALKARLDETLLLYRRGLFPLVMVSGAHGKEGFDEGTVMKRYLVARGVPEAAVIADNEGENTWATAHNATALMRARGLKSALVVSQYYHTPRTRLAFSRFGVKSLYWAHARYWNWRDVYAVPREVAGWGEYLFKTAPPDARLSAAPAR